MTSSRKLRPLGPLTLEKLYHAIRHSEPEIYREIFEFCLKKKVQSLDFYDKFHTSKIPVEIGSVVTLISLDLRKNWLRSIPGSIENLINLEILKLRSNNLYSLPESIPNLKNLVHLDLANNHLKVLPDSIGQLTALTELHLDKNLLTEIPEVIGNLSSLQTLSMKKNSLKKLPKSLLKCSKLKTLVTDDNPLSFPPLQIANQGKDAIFKFLKDPSDYSKYMGGKKIIIEPNSLIPRRAAKTRFEPPFGWNTIKFVQVEDIPRHIVKKGKSAIYDYLFIDRTLLNFLFSCGIYDFDKLRYFIYDAVDFISKTAPHCRNSPTAKGKPNSVSTNSVYTSGDFKAGSSYRKEKEILSVPTAPTPLAGVDVLSSYSRQLTLRSKMQESMKQMRAETLTAENSMDHSALKELFHEWTSLPQFKEFQESEKNADHFALNVLAVDDNAQYASDLAKKRNGAFVECLENAKKLIECHSSMQAKMAEFRRWASDYLPLSGLPTLVECSLEEALAFVDKIIRAPILDNLQNEFQEISSRTEAAHGTAARAGAFADEADENQAPLKDLCDAIDAERVFIENLLDSTLVDYASQLEKDLQRSRSMFICLINKYRSNQIDPFIAAVNRATNRLNEFEARAAGPPSLDHLLSTRKAEKAAKKAYKRLQIDIDSDDDEDDDDAAADHKRDIAIARQRWRDASAEHERESLKIALVGSSYFPELKFVSDAVKNLISDGSDLSASRSLDHYDELSELSGSSRRQVFKAKRADGEMCVIKSFSLHEKTSERAFRKEIKFLRRLNHPHVVQFTAAFIEKDGKSLKGYVEMPLYEHGDLWQWKAAVDPDADLLRHVLRSALLGIAYIHSCKIIHSDIKPQNILVGEGHEARLADFDVSKDDSERAREAMTTVALPTAVGFTVSYVAPELLHPGAKPTVQSDLYSFGLTIFDVSFCNSSADSPPRPSSLEIFKGTKQIMIPGHCNANDLIGILRRLLTNDPAKRPSSASTVLIDSPYFSSTLDDKNAAVVDCCICFESKLSSKGIYCSSKAHFQCADCLSNYVSAMSKADAGLQLLVNDGSGLKCPIKSDNLHDERAYDNSQLAILLSAVEFQNVMAVRSRHAEQRLAAEFEVQFQAKLREREAMSMLDRHRNFIVERILNLACPRCDQSFIDFSDCFALTCSRCKCAFCAWCLTDCGNDAHSHVVKCPYGNNEFYGSVDQFEQAQKKRRQRKIHDFFSQLPDKQMKKELANSLKKEFDDLNIIAPV